MVNLKYFNTQKVIPPENARQLMTNIEMTKISATNAVATGNTGKE
jgi:hypothetical protein